MMMSNCILYNFYSYLFYELSILWSLGPFWSIYFNSIIVAFAEGILIHILMQSFLIIDPPSLITIALAMVAHQKRDRSE